MFEENVHLFEVADNGAFFVPFNDKVAVAIYAETLDAFSAALQSLISTNEWDGYYPYLILPADHPFVTSVTPTLSDSFSIDVTITFDTSDITFDSDLENVHITPKTITTRSVPR